MKKVTKLSEERLQRIVRLVLEQDDKKIPLKLIYTYLDGLNWHTWDIGDGEFNVAEGEFGKDQMKFRIQYSSYDPNHEFNVLYISDELITKTAMLFSLSVEDSIKTIIDWFNKKYDKSLTIDDFEWFQDIDNED
jgi:hypothetical protein